MDNTFVNTGIRDDKNVGQNCNLDKKLNLPVKNQKQLPALFMLGKFLPQLYV
jgi:hypothetical protein